MPFDWIGSQGNCRTILIGSCACDETLPANVDRNQVGTWCEDGRKIRILSDGDGSRCGELVSEGQVAIPFDKGMPDVRRGGDLSCGTVSEST